MWVVASRLYQYIIYMHRLVLAVYFVRHCELFAALCTTSSEYATAIGGLHAFAETVFVVSLAIVGLECSFHDYVFLLFLFQEM